MPTKMATTHRRLGLYFCESMPAWKISVTMLTGKWWLASYSCTAIKDGSLRPPRSGRPWPVSCP